MTDGAVVAGAELEDALAQARTVAGARHHHDEVPGRADRWSAIALGGVFVLVCVVLGLHAGTPLLDEVITFALLALAHALASRVVFESSAGSAVATEPVLVVALLTLPIQYAPIVVLLGLLSTARPSTHRAHDWRSRIHELLVRASSGWHALGPVAVFAVAGHGRVSLDQWQLYVVALGAQFVIEVVVAMVRCRSLGLSWRVLVGPMAWTCSLDALLAPIGLASVLATGGSRWALLFACCPIGILALLGRDRVEHLETAVAISEAFEAAIASARLDPLAGIANRRAWNEAMSRTALEFAANPAGGTAIVVLADIDGLKVVNDSLGHEAGDDLIRAAATALDRAAPAGALVARIGGDEFGMLVVDHPSMNADTLLGHLRAAIDAHPSVHGVRLSLSLGAASCPPGVDVEEAQAIADERARADKARRYAGR